VVQKGCSTYAALQQLKLTQSTLQTFAAPTQGLIDGFRRRRKTTLQNGQCESNRASLLVVQPRQNVMVDAAALSHRRPLFGEATGQLQRYEHPTLDRTNARAECGDRRQVDQQPEKILIFETEATKLGEPNETVKFSMPVNDDVLGNFSIVVELRRNRSTLRGVVRLRPGLGVSSNKASDFQMEIEFPDKT